MIWFKRFKIIACSNSVLTSSRSTDLICASNAFALELLRFAASRRNSSASRILLIPSISDFTESKEKHYLKIERSFSKISM
jgi:hypothetical protein